MKKFRLQIILSLITLLFLFSLTAPIQDHSSSEYHIWLKEHQNELARSREKQKLFFTNNFKFDRLEVIIVSPGEKYYSWWGHVLLHLVGSNKLKPDDDLVISFLADFNDFPLNKIKAGFGGYDVLVKTDTLSQFIKDYSDKEHRTMNYYPLISTNEQNTKLLSVLRKWIQNPKVPGFYTFFYKNCVGLMNHLLYEATILKEPGMYGYFPKYVAQNYISYGILRNEIHR